MGNFAKLLLDALIIGLVVRRENALTNRAYEQLREPTKNLWFSPLFDPANFIDEGQLARRRALRFWRWAVPMRVYVCLSSDQSVAALGDYRRLGAEPDWKRVGAGGISGVLRTRGRLGIQGHAFVRAGVHRWFCARYSPQASTCICRHRRRVRNGSHRRSVA